MNLNENINRIKQVMGLIKEETEEDLKKILKDKFPLHNFFGGTFEKQGDVIIQKSYSKNTNSNYVLTYNPSENFFVVDYVDGQHKGDKIKRWEEDGIKEAEFLSSSELDDKVDKKIEEFPCLSDVHYTNIRQTNDGKIIVGIEWGDGGIFNFNLDDKTYTVKGGNFDGEEGSFLCNGDKIKWTNKTKEPTQKTVTSRMVPEYFGEVSASKPIIYGMRDSSFESENGLIYLLQKRLKELNLYTGEPDGQFGPLTKKAIITFQKTGKDSDGKPLVVDGKVGPRTIQSLGLKD